MLRLRQTICRCYQSLFRRSQTCPQTHLANETVEKYSGLGKAIRYVIKHHVGLSYFCSTEGGINVFDYFTTLQRENEQVKKTPEDYLPWNYLAKHSIT
jgi:hypothetical protein